MLKSLSLAVAAIMLSLGAHASVLTFTDRAAFQNAVNGYQVDTLNDLTDGHLTSLDRGAYTINISMYRCASGPGACGDNASQGFTYPAYIWTYGSGTFNFTNPTAAFGLDFGNYDPSVASVTLNGHTYSQNGGGFFGILDTGNTFTTVNYSATGSGSLFDNVTYAAPPASVPEPGSIALMGLALAGLAAARRRKG